MRVTVMAADSALGFQIVTEASSSELEITAVASDPARWPAPKEEVKVVRGDLLDLTCPERFLGDSDVVVVPLGSSDTAGTDFSTDLHAATVLGQASERIASNTTLVVLAGRAPHDIGTTRDPGLHVRSHEDGARQLAEYAAVQMFSMHLHLEWIYICPSGRISSSDGRRGLHRAIRYSPEADACSISRYLGAVIDVIERHGDRPSAIITTRSSASAPISVPLSADIAARRS